MAEPAEELASGIRSILQGRPIIDTADPVGYDAPNAEPPAPPEGDPQQQYAYYKDLSRNTLGSVHAYATQLYRLTSGEDAIRERRIIEFVKGNLDEALDLWLEYERQREQYWDAIQQLP